MRFPVRFPMALTAFALAALSACAGGGPKSPAPPLSGQAFEGKILAVILPDSASASLKDARDLAGPLREAFPGDGSANDGAVLARAFGDAFWSGFAPALAYVTPIRVPDSVPPAPEGRRVGPAAPAGAGSPAPAFAVPDSGWLAGHGARADLVLAVGPVSARPEADRIEAYEFGGSIKITRFILEGGYLLWDYSAGRVLAQGRFRSKVEYRGIPRAKDWMKAFDEALEQVGEATPFRGPKWYRR